MTALRQLIVLSLDPWDEVKRRNQLLVEELLAEDARLRVLYVEPALAALRNFRRVRPPRLIRRRPLEPSDLTVIRPIEWIPDRVLAYTSPTSGRAVAHTASDLGFNEPVLWVNDHSLARFALGTGWPVVYDITDDWLLAELPGAKRRRAELDDALLMREADAVVVCSPALAASRSGFREVVEIPNGVDVAHFTAPRPRPPDLGESPVAVYLGTLHDERLDVKLCCDIADELADVRFVYVGPDCLRAQSSQRLARRTNVALLGARPYDVAPAYLQHADVVFVPHLVSPFTESLDPIKAREILVVGTRTIATPVAGFRELGQPVRVVSPDGFAAALRSALTTAQSQIINHQDVGTWTDAAQDLARYSKRQ